MQEEIGLLECGMIDETLDLDQMDFFARTEGLKIEDICDDLSLLRFIDVESSGLGKESYPIEYGSCGLDLKPVSFLIGRRKDFSLSEWSVNSQNLHNITPGDLEEFGIDANEAVHWIKRDLSPGIIALSDNPLHDTQWLSMLTPELGALDIYPVSLFLRRAQIAALERQGYERLSQAAIRVQQQYLHLHRAGPDSLRAAAQFRLLVDDEYVDAVLRN